MATVVIIGSTGVRVRLINRSGSRGKAITIVLFALHFFGIALLGACDSM